MKQIIKGDTEPAHLVVANKALEVHKSRYGEGNKYKHLLYNIRYRNKHFQVEVITRRVTMTATVIAGARSLSRILETG